MGMGRTDPYQAETPLKTTLSYGQKSFGNDRDAPHYDLAVASGTGNEPTVEATFTFPSLTRGRGINWESRGDVKSVVLSFPPGEARRVATALLWHLENGGSTPVNMRFGQGSQ
jgi:hypothetical protein